MSSTTEWRNLADELPTPSSISSVPETMFQMAVATALRAACDRIDELEGLRKASGMGASLPCMHCSGVFREWRKVQARIKALEIELGLERNRSANWAADAHKHARRIEALEAWKRAMGEAK